MQWHEIQVTLPLALLESTYNFLWLYVNGLSVAKKEQGFLVRAFLFSSYPHNLLKKLNSFLRIQVKSRPFIKLPLTREGSDGGYSPNSAAKYLPPSANQVNDFPSEEFIIVPTPTSDIPPFGMPIFIQRGRAFGIGSHSSTLYCLEALKLVLRDQRTTCKKQKILDAGTGTGILSIAAVKLGAEDITGVEISLESIREAQENMRINGITNGIRIHHCSVTEIKEQFDVVLANLYGFFLVEIAPSLIQLLAPNGRLVMGGMTVPHDDVVITTYMQYGLKEQARYRDEEWAAAVLQRI